MSSLQELVADFQASVAAVLTLMRQADPSNSQSTTTTQAFRESLDACAKVVSAGATKVAVSFSAEPKLDEAKPLLEAWYASILAICDLYKQFPVTTGTALRDAYSRAIVGVVEACVTFLAALQRGIKENNTKAHYSSAGVVWEHCDALVALPHGNTGVTSQRLKDAEELVQDAIMELKEELLTVGDDASGEDSEGEAWSEEEKVIASPVLSLCLAATKVLGKVRTQVLKLYGEDDAEDIAELDKFGALANLTSEQVDDLVAATYPPQDRDALKDAAQALADTANGVVQQSLAKARSLGEADHAELIKTLDFLDSAVAHNRAKLESKLA